VLSQSSVSVGWCSSPFQDPEPHLSYMGGKQDLSHTLRPLSSWWWGQYQIDDCLADKRED